MDSARQQANELMEAQPAETTGRPETALEVETRDAAEAGNARGRKRAAVASTDEEVEELAVPAAANSAAEEQKLILKLREALATTRAVRHTGNPTRNQDKFAEQLGDMAQKYPLSQLHVSSFAAVDALGSWAAHRYLRNRVGDAPLAKAIKKTIVPGAQFTSQGTADLSWARQTTQLLKNPNPWDTGAGRDPMGYLRRRQKSGVATDQMTAVKATAVTSQSQPADEAMRDELIVSQQKL